MDIKEKVQTCYVDRVNLVDCARIMRSTSALFCFNLDQNQIFILPSILHASFHTTHKTLVNLICLLFLKFNFTLIVVLKSVLLNYLLT